VAFSVEPSRRDPFPAIALATAYLADVQGVDPEEPVVVCPVDPYVEDDYFEALKALSEQAAKSEANLVLMGIEPTYPSEKYGYIIPKNSSAVSDVATFKEKPDAETAKAYIAQGALWNGGVFAYKLRYVLDKAHELIDFTDYKDLFDKYAELNKISFDYAVVEKEPKIQVMRFAGQWKDLGTWNTLTEAMGEPSVGKAMMNDTCTNVHVVNELNVPVLAMGLHDVVISASPEGILVSDKEQSSYIKPYVDKIDQQIMFAEKSWGSFRVLDVEDESLTIKVTLNPGHSMNYHSHMNRDEVWVVISGTGRTVVDGVERPVHVGDVVQLVGETCSTATLELLGGQNAMLETLADVARETGKPLVVVLMSSKPQVMPACVIGTNGVIVDESTADGVSAFMWAPNPGMKGGQAIAEIILGETEPSGRLPITFPRHAGQLPVYYNQIRGQHGNRYADLTQDPAFAFGEGLGYTTFEYGEPTITNVPASGTFATTDTVHAEVALTNTGERKGTEVAQLYIGDIVTSYSWTDRELKAFQRVELEPGETKTVGFDIPVSECTIVNSDANRIVEPGEFEVLIGHSSRRKDLKRTTFTVA